MQWQSMKTAPKDGTEVLVTTTEEDVVLTHWNASAEMWVRYRYFLCTDQLRAWMPKPAPYTGTVEELDAEGGDA